MSNIFKRIKYYIFRNRAVKDGPLVTLCVIGACCIVYLLQWIIGARYGSEVDAMIALGGYYRNYVIILHQYWRFITYGLVHGSIFHLLMNMYALFNLGTTLETMLGHKRFALALFLSTIGGGLLAHLTNSELVVGLSGGLYGLLGILFIVAYKAHWLENPQVRASFIRTILVNLLISLMPSVSMAGHIGGLIIGILLGLVFTTPKSESKTVYYYNKIVAVCLCFVVLGIMAYRDNTLIQVYSNDLSVLEIYQDFGINVDGAVQKIYKTYIGG